MHCPHCGSPLAAPGEKFCRICGNSLVVIPAGNPGKQRSILDERYEILEKMGTGGMGVLYRVRDKRLDRIFALKEMRVTFPDEAQKKKAEEWFQREAKILCNLRHPNVPVVIDFFTENDKNYLVMDFIDGVSLEKKSLPIGETEIRAFLAAALDILRYLHNQDLIHRDIKTEHFMEDKAGKYFLVDFGTARALSPTERKTAIGTPGYASPEHYEGFADRRSDIYSLGAVMYHLATGIDPRTRPPFDFRPLRESVPAFSPKLAKIIEKMLAYKPEERFQKVEEIEASLSSAGEIAVQTQVMPPVSSVSEITTGSKTTKKLKSENPLKTLLLEEPDYDDYSTLHRKREVRISNTALAPISGIKGEVFREIQSPHLGWISSIAFVPPGDVLAVAYADGVIMLWDITRGEQMGVLKKEISYSPNLCLDVAASANGELLAQALDNGKVNLWDLVTNRKIRTIATNSAAINRMVFSGNKTLITGSRDESVAVWNVDEFRSLNEKWGNLGGVSSLALSNDRKLLVIGCGDGYLRLWEIHSMVSIILKPEHERGHRGKVRDLSFSRGDDYLISIGDDRYLKLWKVEGTQPAVIKPHKTTMMDFESVSSVACSPRQDIFVTGKQDGSLRMWDLQTFKPVKSLSSHDKTIVRISFSQNGCYFATASEDGLVVAWK